jgi:hypothetical protein
MAARPYETGTKHKEASIIQFVPSDACLKDYKKRRSTFLKELIALTPNVSVRAKEFRRWIDENSPHSDNDKVDALADAQRQYRGHDQPECRNH